MELIQHIDEIARKLKRDVLYLEFHPLQAGARHEADAMRRRTLEWLGAHHITWLRCGPYASVTRMEPYRGQVYLDVPFDENLPLYQELRNYLEHSDGSMKHPDVRFMVMTLDRAMQNSEHDEPGFWTRWADQF